MKEYSIKKTLASAIAITSISIALSSISVAMKPKTVTIKINNNPITLETKAKDVKELLDNIGYKFIPGSKINTTFTSKISDGMNIKIDTKKNISLNNGGKILNITTFASTVRDLLKDRGIKLDKDDRVSPYIDSVIKNGQDVTIDYININDIKKNTEIHFKTIKKLSFDLEYGKTITRLEGKNGSKNIIYRKISKNGKLISNKKYNEEIVKSPINKIVIKGTKEIVNETIKAKVEKKFNSNLYKDQTKIIVKGKNGKKQIVYKNDGKTRSKISEKQISKPKKWVIEVGTKKRPSIAKTNASYSLSQFMRKGIVNWGGYKFTYYSQSVLPGGGLKIPGRHINSAGYVADENGYIVLANSAPKGTIINTPFGFKGKVYDRGTSGNHFDVYIR